ncbi:MAG: sigma-70 family RNA polymerase sigma factor [Myxococcota bacterium]
MASDTELLTAWRNGDGTHGQELCLRYIDAVARFFANKLGDQTNDLVQETFKALVEGRDRISDDTRFRSYLFGIAYNVLKQHLKRRYRAPEDLQSRSLQDLAPGVETILRGAEQLRLLKAALRRIPLQHQVALELRHWEELSSAEIGEVLGVAPSTVRTNLGRARTLLEAELEKETTHLEAVQSTISNLDAWAEELRDVVNQGKAS